MKIRSSKFIMSNVPVFPALDVLAPPDPDVPALPAPDALQNSNQRILCNFRFLLNRTLQNDLSTIRMNRNFFIKGYLSNSVSNGFNLSPNNLSKTLLKAIKESFYLFDFYVKSYHMSTWFYNKLPDSIYLFTTGFGISSYSVVTLKLIREGTSMLLDLQWTINGMLQNRLRFSLPFCLYIPILPLQNFEWSLLEQFHSHHQLDSLDDLIHLIMFQYQMLKSSKMRQLS